MAEKSLSKLPPKDRLKELIDDFETAVTADSAFQIQANRSFSFTAGHQWTADERKILKEANRPCMTFNLCRPSVKLINGINAQNRVRISPEPREENDQFLCDLLTDLVEFIDDKTSSESEQDDCFDNSVQAGRGYVGIDFKANPANPMEIKIEENSIPVHEVRLDPSGRRDDLKDHSKIFREKWIDRETFKVQYPKFAKDIDEIFDGFTDEIEHDAGKSDAVWDDMDAEGELADYDKSINPDYYDRQKELVRIVHCEYWQAYNRYYGANPQTGKVEEFEKKNLKILKAKIPNFEYDTITDKKVMWCQFTGDKILYDGESPLPYDGFSIVPMFCYKDKSDRRVSHVGIIKDMIDPNREVNRRWSQALNLLQNQGQGVMAEAGAFLNINQAMSTWNDPTRPTIVTDGALEGHKIQEKPVVELSTGVIQMEGMAQDMIKKIGMNPDLLGQEQSSGDPGIVVRLRQQQGKTLLEGIFNNYRFMKKEIYKRKLAIIMKYMPDSQIQQILGGGDRYQIQDGVVSDTKRQLQAPIRNVRDINYDVKIDDAPGNMSRQMFELAIFMEMLKTGFPVDPKTVISKLDLSAGEKADWVEFVEKGQESQSKMQQMEAQLEQAKIQIEQAKAQADGQVKTAEVQRKAQADKVDAKLKQTEIQRKEQDDIRDHQVALAKIKQDEKESLRNYKLDLSKMDDASARLVMDMAAKLSEDDKEKAAQPSKGVAA